MSSVASAVKRSYRRDIVVQQQRGFSRVQRERSFQPQLRAILGARASTDGHRNHGRACRAFQFQRLHDEGKLVGPGS
jgi:hypothetical protein